MFKHPTTKFRWNIFYQQSRIISNHLLVSKHFESIKCKNIMYHHASIENELKIKITH